MHPWAAIFGVALILVILWDAFQTIVLSRRVSRVLRPTRAFYRVLWTPWRAAAKRIRRGNRRENVLMVFGPLSLILLDVATGASRRVAANRVYTPLISLTYSWSPDSRWLAYTVQTHPLVSALSIYDAEQDKSTSVTDGLSEVTQPVFERNGKYLYVLASTDAGPALDWFALSSAPVRRTRAIYAIALTKDAPNPFVRESDEEKDNDKSTDRRAGRVPRQTA